MDNNQMPPQGEFQQPQQPPQGEFQQPQQPQQPAPQAPQNNNARIALILGIIALACPVLAFASCCFPAIAGLLSMFPIAGLVCGIIGLVWSLKAKKQGANVTAALVLSIVGLALSAITFFSCTLCVGCASCLGCAAGGALEDLGGMDPSELEDLLEGLM